jgi:LysM repeat protein
MLPFILINIVVSATVILAILFWWDSRKTEQTETSTATAMAATAPVVAATIEAVSQATETPEAETGPLMHTVKAGETLGSLSEFYDVPMEDVMTANDLSNPNLIAVGQQLIIPIGGIPTATPPPTNTPAPEQNELPTPIPTDEPLTDGEAIVEITAVTGNGN